MTNTSNNSQTSDACDHQPQANVRRNGPNIHKALACMWCGALIHLVEGHWQSLEKKHDDG